MNQKLKIQLIHLGVLILILIFYPLLNPLDHCADLTRDRAAAQWRGLVVPVGNVVATLIVKQCGGCYLRTSLGVISVTKWLLFLYF